MTKRLGIGLAAAMLAMLYVGSPVLAEGYYRWVDEQGQVHFSQRPPENRPAEYISRATGRSIYTPGPAAREEVEPPVAQSGETGPAAIEQVQGLPEKDPEQCRQARETLQVLETFTRIRARSDDGSVRMLSQEERETQRQQAQQVIELHC